MRQRFHCLPGKAYNVDLLLYPESQTEASDKNTEAEYLPCHMDPHCHWRRQDANDNPAKREEDDDCNGHENTVRNTSSVESVKIEHDHCRSL
jgi:hypothetical protein